MIILSTVYLFSNLSFYGIKSGKITKTCSCIVLLSNRNNTKRSHTQLDSRKQVIAFQDRVVTINIKEAQHPLK